MILAAGLGTRLKPLTDHTPKALVTVGGIPMLERIALRMIAAGVDRLIINVHHHADQVTRFIEERDGFGVDVKISPEEGAPLETGGGVLHARSYFREDAPFLLHNVDVVSETPLESLYRAHLETGALVTLAVSDRSSSRLLAFDDRGLCGRIDTRSGKGEWARRVEGDAVQRAFAGIHVVSPAWFDLVEERGAFSIMAPYLRLGGERHPILPYDVGDSLWLEVGDLDRLERARALLRGGTREGAG
jgi:N-acetyl-alpha-D-muramate 1-phosphate uridylyltransferase